MLLSYSVLNPNGNITALVTSEINRDKYKYCADEIMRKNKAIEQVGFIEKPKQGCAFHLQMTGGEFCGNASLSAAALYLKSRHLTNDSVMFTVSGADKAIHADVKETCSGQYEGLVEMPLPIEIGKLEITDKYGIKQLVPVVIFKGIAHAVCPFEPGEDPENIVKKGCGVFGVPCFGLMLTDKSFCSIKPLVYVQDADTCVYEGSCASGTAALGAYLACAQGLSSVTVKQPKGELRVITETEQGFPASIKLNATVNYVSECSISI